MSQKHKKIAFVFPGQGAQYVGMGKDFYESHLAAREVFEEADDILKRKVSTLAFTGPEELLRETQNSQVAIFVNSLAILKVIQKQFPDLKPAACSGLSLGEYTALTSSGRMTFAHCLPLVQYRAQFMNDACEATKGTMAAIFGLEGSVVEKVVKELGKPNDLWVANYNCPGQIVISGTLQGVEAGSAALLAAGAKRAIPLQVHGAFHSGLMKQAEVRLAEKVKEAPVVDSPVGLVMNVTGGYVSDLKEIKNNLVKQVTHSVLWEQGIRALEASGVDLFVEIGCGTTLAGMNKRIGVKVPTISVDKVGNLDMLAQIC